MGRVCNILLGLFQNCIAGTGVRAYHYNPQITNVTSHLMTIREGSCSEASWNPTVRGKEEENTPVCLSLMWVRIFVSCSVCSWSLLYCGHNFCYCSWELGGRSHPVICNGKERSGIFWSLLGLWKLRAVRKKNRYRNMSLILGEGNVRHVIDMYWNFLHHLWALNF